MTKITLRMKPISNNRQTLYLDYYPPIPHPFTGKQTRREFLKLFLFDEIEHQEQTYLDNDGKLQRRIVPLLDRNGKEKKVKLKEVDKQHNKDTLALAEAIRAKRQLAVQKGNYGFLSDEKENTNFVTYFEALANKRKGSNSDNWLSALQYLKNFTRGSIIRFKDLNETFCNDFKDYLLTAPSRKSNKTTLSQNSAVSYFNKLKAALKQAYKEGYLESDLNKRIETIKTTETERQFLTLEELQALANADCPTSILKRAALFSALTGLRFSDILKLIWSEVHFDKADGYYIRFRQKKTKGTETLPISEQAAALMGMKGEGAELVFKGLEYSLTQTDLPKWLRAAGIKKAITFHSFRHTYATLLISKNIDLYTVSKMLGHREIKTTQIYAKIIDKQKREAANKIQLKL
jgi:integrase